MSKLLILFLLALVALAVYVGVIEIRFRPEKVLGLNELNASLFQDKSLWTKTRTQMLGLKRRGELLLIKDQEKRLTLALVYVKTDAAGLSSLVSKNATPSELLAQGKLLSASLKLARKLAFEAPASTIASLKQDSFDSFAAAQDALNNLQVSLEKTEAENQALKDVVTSLSVEIGVSPSPSPVPE